jgi:hypothetical protein
MDKTCVFCGTTDVRRGDGICAKCSAEVNRRSTRRDPDRKATSSKSPASATTQRDQAAIRGRLKHLERMVETFSKLVTLSKTVTKLADAEAQELAQAKRKLAMYREQGIM